MPEKSISLPLTSANSTTKTGQVIYAILIGFLTAIFRVLGSSAEGVSYAIIISNLVVPLIEKITVPKAFGMRKKEEA